MTELELIKENSLLRQKIKELEQSESERLRAEGPLRASEALLKTYLENAPDGIYMLDMKGNFLYGNRRSEEIIGYSRNELIGKSFFESNLLSKKDLNRAIKLFQASIEGRSTGPDEIELINKEGRLISVEINTSVVQGADQRIVLGFVRDINERKQEKAALQESEERYRQLVEGINKGIFVVQDGMLKFVNPMFIEIFGYSENDLTASFFTEFIHPDDRNMVMERHTRRMRGEEFATKYEFRIITADGRVKWVEIDSVMIQWEGKRATLGFIDDITERKESEEALKLSEITHREIFNKINDTIWVHDIETWEFLDVNDSVTEMFGYTVREAMDLSVEDVSSGIPPFTQETAVELLKKAAAGEPQLFEWHSRHKDGRLFWTEVNLKRGTIAGKECILAIERNIADRKRTEEEILKEREKLQILSDNAPFGMVLIDNNGHFTYINTKFTQLFGYDLSDIPDGRTWFRKAYPDAEYRHMVISTWLGDLRDVKPGERKPRVFTATCKNGVQRIMEFIPSKLASGDYLMTCEDITELRKLESQLRQAQKMESIGTLAGGVAHDFNNILTALMGYTSLIKMKMDKNSPLQPYVDQILSASRKATDLTQGLLAFSRQQPITLVPIDMNGAIKKTEQLLKRLLTEDIELCTSLTKDTTVVMADRSQVDQVLFNLATNARDAMPKGGTLTIETDIADMDSRFIGVHGFGKPGRYVLISISDTGEGMDKATQGKIFDPFFTTKEIGKGTGLGLATVYGIIKQHNGYITVYSEPGQGTTFRVYLPAAMTKAGEEQDAATPPKGGRETILIAEDEEEVRHIMREALQEYGYRTIETIDGEDAVDKFKLHRDIDLIILDSVMPKKNGREAYEEIRGIDPQIKVLFTSGYTKDVVLNKGIKDKEFDFIAKPLILDEFLQKVRDVLDNINK